MAAARNVTLDFVGLGAAKAGTTWLARCLAEHPQVAMSQPKELNYFGDYTPFPEIGSNFGASPVWLAERFAHARPGQIRGEFSPTYLPDPAVPARLRVHNPQLKLLICYREPVARLYSYYHQLLKEYPVPGTFEEFVRTKPGLVENGFYARQTRAVLDVFPAAQVHYMLFDEIAHDPGKVLRRLFTFLGVDPHFIPPTLHQKVNERRKPRSLVLRDTINRIRVLLNSSAAARAARRSLIRLGAERLMHRLLEANLVDAPIAPMSAEMRKRLQKIYAPEVRDLQGLTGLDLRSWLESDETG